ncbi:MAG: Protoheme IX farnesyltransferase, mitochondrial [Bogoriella megaspora]|nr:MAG: Protoheme IX farnesyltransferase, mitochondrial [Bogoriella megaspora]
MSAETLWRTIFPKTNHLQLHSYQSRDSREPTTPENELGSWLSGSRNAVQKQENVSTNENRLHVRPEARTTSSIGVPQHGTTPPHPNPSPLPTDIQPLPHRRRKRLKPHEPDPSIPPDASSVLTTISARLPRTSLRRLLTTYLSLSKPRLTFLIVLTTTASYAIYPAPSILLSASTNAPSLSPLILLFLTTGTSLCSASANALNMAYEPGSDSLMSRTRNRPLVRRLLSLRAALMFALLTGTLGTTILYTGVNPTVAALGALNILLYAGVYTPLKPISVLNTWAGALVGAIPPLMGWCAAAAQCSSSYRNTDGSPVSSDPGWRDLLFAPDGSSIGGWLLAGLLFAWQFPHFNALSHSIREEYKNAGLRMMAWVDPRRNARIAFRYAVVMFPICVGLSWTGVTSWGFVASSGVVNTWMVVQAWRFWKYTGEKGSARGLFWASVWHLPIVLVLAMAQKKGLWERMWSGAFGQALLDEDEDEDEEEDSDEEVHEEDWEARRGRQPVRL